MSNLYKDIKTIIDRSAKNSQIDATILSVGGGLLVVRLTGAKSPSTVPVPVDFNGKIGDVVSLGRNKRTGKWQLSNPASESNPSTEWQELLTAALSFDVGALPETGDTLVIETLLKQASGALVNPGFRIDNDATASGYVVSYSGQSGGVASNGAFTNTSALITNGSAAFATADQFSYARIIIPMFRESGYRKQFHIQSGGIVSAYFSNGAWILSDTVDSIQITQSSGAINFIAGCRWRVTSF